MAPPGKNARKPRLLAGLQFRKPVKVNTPGSYLLRNQSTSNVLNNSIPKSSSSVQSLHSNGSNSIPSPGDTNFMAFSSGFSHSVQSSSAGGSDCNPVVVDTITMDSNPDSSSSAQSSSAAKVNSTPSAGDNIIVASSASIQSAIDGESNPTPPTGDTIILVPTPEISSSSQSLSSESPFIEDASQSKKSNRPRFYMTKYRKIVEKKNSKMKKKHIYAKAKTDLEAGKFKSVRQCAAFYKLPSSTLHRLLLQSDDYQGSGRKSSCLSIEEEKVIIKHVKWRSQIGCGVDYSQLQSLVQKSLLALVSVNPSRKTGYESTGQRPNRFFIRRLVERHNISLRRTAEISKGKFKIILINLLFNNLSNFSGRQILTVSDLRSWQNDTVNFMSSKPDLVAALKDPARVFNMDETSVEVIVNLN